MLARSRVFSLVVAGCLAAGPVVAAGPAMAAAQPRPAATEFGYSGSAFGTEVNIASTVKSGRSALATLGCTSEIGLTHTNSVASVTVPGLLSSGTVTTSAASEQTAAGPASSSSATTDGASLLGGLVTATAIQSVSTTTRGAHKFGISAAGTEFLGLTVAGVPISGTPAPNTKISLPGVGYVELNQQSGHVSADSARLTVIGIHLFVTLSTPLAPVGTEIIVSDAHSSLGGPVSGVLDGTAYGASANVANTIIAGREFPKSLGCLGTGGVTRSNTGAAIGIPGIVDSGTVADTVEGVNTASTVSGEVTSTIEGLNLLSGLVTATAIKADVTAAGNPPALGNHSTFLGLSVAGFPGITDHVPPNTRLSLAGLGTLWLNRQLKTANKITVIMVQLHVTVPGNPLGLAVGTVVNIAYASVGVK